MKKGDLERIVELFLDAAPEIVVAARHTRTGACMICDAPRGTQHDTGCALWKLISARIDYRMVHEGKPSPAEDDTVRAETMGLLERGGIPAASVHDTFGNRGLL